MCWKKSLFTRVFIINKPTKCSLMMVLYCVFELVRYFVDFTRRIEVFWWVRLDCGIGGWCGWKTWFYGGFWEWMGDRYEKMTVRWHDKNSLIAKVFIFKYNLPLSIYQQSHLRIFIRLRKIWKISHWHTRTYMLISKQIQKKLQMYTRKIAEEK